MHSIAPSLAYIADDLSLSTSQQEMASASATLSDTITMLVGGHLADAFGRRRTAIAACMLSIVGALGILIFHASFSAFLIWRLCAGIGNALSILVLPMYISESVSTSRRGRCISLYQLGVLSGTLLPYAMMLLSENWKLTFTLGAVPGLLIGGCFFTGYFPESRHHAPHLAEFHKQPDANNSSSHVMLLFLGVLLAYSNNSIDPTLFYGPTIISQFIRSSSRVSANLVGLGLSSLSVLSVAAAAAFLRPTFPRRPLYLVCHGVVVVCFLAASVLFAASSSSAVLAVLGVMILFQTCGPGLLFVLIVSELFQDPAVRATSMGYCTFAMSAFSLLINGTLLSLFSALGVGGTFAAYGVSYAACWVVFYLYLPETSTRQVQA
ncbi:hypothetical protein, variant 1 [Aphanomyces astaci]|uniref:Major facilitator superfamily (MFS) profile domain-containing protein n=1 Tax=Aphanomyces astaci TaxID=112090 RepID=W4FQ71_APHAT|nr:hypothetical protein, variant 1 [Aphanomyces astaci]ETV68833.1 hypothetical protein, variant 1 [Aphanomyces astaci]|eukprot:XP_009841787.1 hypothetical protein, variant 1 [Aphanomyces astaci]